MNISVVNSMTRFPGLVGFAVMVLSAASAIAQTVCLPAPRLLTTMPMGGQAGTEFDVTVTGENIDELRELRFSHPGITARFKDGTGKVPNQFVVSIAEGTPESVYEARLLTRLGISSCRTFTVGRLPEVIRTDSNTTLDSALQLDLNSICNASTKARAVDYYRFEGQQGQRVVVSCLARGIDSKLNPVVVLGDSQGRDLLVERRGGALDFVLPEAGQYTIKVHDLTFQGGPEFFYRLAIQDWPATAPLPRFPATRHVGSFSWPPPGLSEGAADEENEPNNELTKAEKISLPCDVAGSFFPAADVDTFEFNAKKGDVWWVEVASERLGLPTNPSILVQHVERAGTQETVTDVAQFTDIASPMKPSTNHYTYDGPPYDGGSPDILAKLEIERDGLHRLQLRDLFGGTRNDQRNVYRLIVRRPEPGFALVAWAMHMELRNGDRNSLSKPLALRPGETRAFEVVAIRRDGFEGAIELGMNNLPPGVTAAGVRIPKGSSRGTLLVTAGADAPPAVVRAEIVGQATIGGETVTRPCQLASMAWPVRDGWREIPNPRLVQEIMVSVTDSEVAPLTISPSTNEPLVVRQGEKLIVPLAYTKRCEFSGTTIGLRTFGEGFEKTSRFEVPLTQDGAEATLDLAVLGTPPGDYVIAFYGGVVALHRHNPKAVAAAALEHKLAVAQAAQLATEAERLTAAIEAASPDEREAARKTADAAAKQHKTAKERVEAAAKRLKAATQQAKPKDTAEIIVSEPIAIRVESS